MAELDPLDARLTAAVRAIADRAQTSVDATATAERAMRHRRVGPPTWLGYAVPVPVAILVLLLVLVMALAITLGAGAGRDQRGILPPAPDTTPVTAARSPDSSPLASPDPAVDGTGDEVVWGTDDGAAVATTDLTVTTAGGVTKVRGATYVSMTTMSDPRVSGTGTWSLNDDDHGTTGPAWGAYRLENAGGAWAGTCSGGVTGDGFVRSCWLTGSGGYDGFFYYLTETLAQGVGDVRGVITPGPPGTP
jgi:hypothetical protein